jgi:HEAT repeat protein
VPALAKALQSPNALELSNAEVQVMRNVVNALGEIGPDAREAIPALKTVQHLRVKYIAEEAIAKIEGHPMPTWH